METLVIDNYDSFTWNLVHLIARVSGKWPTVIMNDSGEWNIDKLDYFDNVVITPGPGHPENDRDFGISKSVLLQDRVPVLGVCLGHQGVCMSAGAAVDRAPEPMHGRVSRVIHDGRDILAGIPSPFCVVRYHSLAVSRMTPELEPLGFSEDGVLMAVRHRNKPQWGVQFHPESIQTEYGEAIIRNFFALTQERRRGERMPVRDNPFPSQSGNASKRDVGEVASQKCVSVLLEKIKSTVDAERCFERLYKNSVCAFWLDSSGQDASRGRFSFMGDAGGPHARVAYADVGGGSVTVRDHRGETIIESEFLAWLDKELRQYEKLRLDVPFGFTPGWVGYLGYELKAECGGNLAHRSKTPDAAMIFADRAIAFDHDAGDIYLMALAETETKGAAEAWIRETKSVLIRLETSGHEPECASATSPSSGLMLRHERLGYLQLIRQSQEFLRSGESYEICLTNMLHVPPLADPWLTYRTLRKNNPVPFGAMLKFDQLCILSSSPERFLRISDSGQVESKPIKGTRPRSADPILDSRYAEELRYSEKDRAENLMIVDLVRNDLGRWAEVGSVHVPKLFDIESYATVHQMVSTIQAQLRPGCSVVDCVRAAFPGGSMTGAPKIRTMQIIDGLEGGPRGIYSGALGYFSLSGSVDLSIVIRTLVATPQEVTYGVGGAITVLSDPHDEFEETAVKATPLLRLTGGKFPGRQECTVSRPQLNIRPRDRDENGTTRLSHMDQ